VDSESQQYERLTNIAAKVREHVVRMSMNGGCFLGASLSCVDLLVSMYADCLNLSPDLISDPDRDIVLLSKGHAVPALYGTLAELGYFPAARLAAHLSTDDSIYWHPNADIPGVEFHSGSLGHLLSVGIGMALDARLRGSESRVFVIVGDGELNEGSIWEAVLVARAQELNRLFLLVDRNQLQANIHTEDLSPLEPLAAKFEAFGWAITLIDGHSFKDLRRALTGSSTRRPTAIIANTVRGKGIPEHEGRVDKWFVKSNAEQGAELMAVVRGSSPHKRGTTDLQGEGGK
jgi:transketolase